jgi:hypothetical protein
MIKWAPSRAGLSLFFLALALVALVFDRQTYKHYSGAEIVVSSKKAAPAAGSTVQTTIKDLTSKLTKPRVEAARYSVAADKNLFSASRKAWQAPAPPPTVTKKDEEPKTPAPVPTRRDVILYGTYISGKTRKAMLHFKRFRKGQMLVAEGAEAKDEESGNPSRRKVPAYTVVKVEAKKVILKDERGSEFTVNLYDNKKRRPVKTVNKANIKIDKSAASQKSAKIVIAPAGGKPAVAAKSSGKSGAPAMSARQIRKLSVEEKDSLVTKGVLKKHNTPFGPVYKRIRK